MPPRLFSTKRRLGYAALPLLVLSAPLAAQSLPDSVGADSLRADSTQVFRIAPSGPLNPAPLPDDSAVLLGCSLVPVPPVVIRGPAPLPLDTADAPPLRDIDLSEGGRRFDPVRAGLAGATLVGGSAALYAWEKSRWWQGSLAPFHVDDHLDYAANLDKAAHFVATDVQALIATEAFEWAGFDRKPAAIAGAATAWLLQLQVEYHDGFYPRWGFDRYDVAANTLGAGWFVAREHVAELRRFDVRWGYVPRDPNPALWFNEDYQHHSYWVSARVWDLLPEPAQAIWPEALALSVGTAVAGWDPSRPYETGTAELYLSLDLDYDAVLPETPLGRSVADVLNRFHLPAPALRLAPEPKVYLVFYGQ